MADYTAKRIDDMEAIFQGGFKRARAELGIESFGMQVLDMPAGYADYPEHDHSGGQEEVYIVLRGGAEVDIEGERVAIDPDTMLRVGPETKRKIYPGPNGIRLLALGGTRGAAYEAGEMSRLGAPDPTAAVSG